MQTRVLIGGMSLLLLFTLSRPGFAADDEGFEPLFDGKTLDGWHGNPELWSVQDGAIVGATDGDIPDNNFLISDRKFSNFILKATFRLHDYRGNSGIQFRSEELKEFNGSELPPFVVGGYQADIASERYMGILYGEKTGRGIIADTSDEVRAALEEKINKDGWNEYVITADGDHITEVLNGITTVDIVDPEGADSGIIALQLHRGHNMKVSFKDLLIKVLP
jgi:3-keto-disaccharide hydrolase